MEEAAAAVAAGVEFEGEPPGMKLAKSYLGALVTHCPNIDAMAVLFDERCVCVSVCVDCCGYHHQRLRDRFRVHANELVHKVAGKVEALYWYNKKDLAKLVTLVTEVPELR